MAKEKNLGSAFVDVQFRPAWKELDKVVSQIEKRFGKMGVDAGNRIANGMQKAVQRMKQLDHASGQAADKQNRVQKELRETGQAAGQSSQMLDKFRGVLAALAGGYVAARVLGAVKQQFMGLYSQGMQSNAQMEVMSVSFEKMIGSTRRATQVMAQLRDFSARTPLLFPQIMKASTGLLATKKVAEKDLLPTLRKMADAAAGSTEGFAAFPRIVRAINQMMSKGRIQAEEMMQLAEAGIPAWKSLADEMGVSIAKARKMGETGKLGATQITKLIDGLGKSYEGLADKQSKTFQGLTSTLKDKVGLLAQKAFKPIFDFAKLRLEGKLKILESSAVQKFAASFADLSDKVIQIIKWGAKNPWVQWFVGAAAVGAAVAALVSVFAGLALTISFIGPGIIGIGVAVGAAASAAVIGFKMISDSFRAAMEGPGGKIMVQNLKDIGRLALEVGKNIRDGFAVGWRAIDLFIRATRSSKQESLSLWGTWVSGVKMGANQMSLLTTDSAKGADVIKMRFVQALLAIMNAGEGTWNWWNKKVAQVAGFLVGSFSWAADKIKSIFNDIKGVVIAFGVALKKSSSMWGIDIEKFKEEFGKEMLLRVKTNGGPTDTMAERATATGLAYGSAAEANQSSGGFALLKNMIEKFLVQPKMDELREQRDQNRANRGAAQARDVVMPGIDKAIGDAWAGFTDLFREVKGKDEEEPLKKKNRATKTSLEGLHDMMQKQLSKDPQDVIKDEALKQTVLLEKIKEFSGRLGESMASLPGALTSMASSGIAKAATEKTFAGEMIGSAMRAGAEGLSNAQGVLGGIGKSLGLDTEKLTLGRLFNEGKVKPITEAEDVRKQTSSLEKLVSQGESLETTLSGMLGFGS